MTDREALKMALDALEQLQGGCTDHDDGTVEAITVWCPEVVDAIKQALAQPEQEPVEQLGGGIFWCDTCRSVQENKHHSDPYDRDVWCKGEAAWLQGPFYVTPPQRPWVGLTDEEKRYLNEVLNLQGRFPIIDAIEAKLKEKNHG